MTARRLTIMIMMMMIDDDDDDDQSLSYQVWYSKSTEE
jgi:hypothetical protein